MDNSGFHYGQYVVPDALTCVNLGVGQPSNKKLPLKELNKAFSSLSKGTNPAFLQYGSIEGYEEFRYDLAHYLMKKYYGFSDAESDDCYPDPIEHMKKKLLVTNGITGGLSLILSVFAKAGDTIFCEDPTYFLALNIFKDIGLKIVPIKIDENGLMVSELKEKIALEDPTKRCFLYTIPFYQNPTGYRLSDERLKELMDLSSDYSNLVILSDEVYNMLRFGEEVSASLPLHHYGKNFITLGSFSKAFCPSLRMGYILADEGYITELAKCGQLDSSGCVNPIGCAVIHDLIRSNKLDTVLKMWLEFLSTNCNTLYDLVTSVLAEYIEFVEKPTGGYFLWVKFKKHISAVKMSETMESFGIKFHHGNKFSPSLSCENYVRLSFSWYEGSDYEIGIWRLKTLLDSMTKTKVYVMGSTGRLGSLIVNELKESDQLLFSGGIGRDIDISQIKCTDVIVDVSSANGTEQLITKLLDEKLYISLVIGTTGDLPMESIRKYARYAPVVLCSNFSKGIREFKKIIDSIDKSLWVASMTEYHHIHKKDKPSGTAKTLAKHYGESYLPTEEIVSVREGEIVGTHEIVLEGKNELIKITHIAKSRELFAEGCLEWIKFIIQKKKGENVGIFGIDPKDQKYEHIDYVKYVSSHGDLTHLIA